MAQEYKTMDAIKKKHLLNKLKHNSTKLWMNTGHLLKWGMPAVNYTRLSNTYEQ